MKKLSVMLLLFFSLSAGPSFAAVDNARLVKLSKEIIQAKDMPQARSLIESAKDMYFAQDEYAACIDFLKSLAKQKKELKGTVDYYTGLCRYQQLKYLEESQSWDEYFARGNDYRDEISESLQKAIRSLPEDDPLSVYSRLILFRFHRDQNDTFAQEALDGLMSAVDKYLRQTADPAVIKDAAGQLFAYGEKVKARELYKVYVEKIISSDISEKDLRDIAEGFYQEGNLELAEALFDKYIERVKEVNSLIEVARLFAFRQDGPNEPLFAEKIFKKIEELGQEGAFDEELMYLRAYNLEKAKDYAQAADKYLNLLKIFPASAHRDEAEYKIAIIYTYALRNIDKGRGYFQSLADKERVSPQVISSLYQLGLLKQWEDDPIGAKNYYDLLLRRAADKFGETVALAELRLKEMESGKPLEHNLEVFMDLSLKGETAAYDINRVGLTGTPYQARAKSNVDIRADSYLEESGCLQPELRYLWSGHLGTAKPAEDINAFNTEYVHSGTKEINLVVLSAGGILGHALDMVDVSSP